MRRFYSDLAPPLALTSNVSAIATSLPVASTAGYPTVPFTLALDRGLPNEEVCLCTSIIDATHFGVTRGYDNTIGVAHNAPATVEHCVCAIDYNEANAFLNLLTTKGDLHAFDGVNFQRLPAGPDFSLFIPDSTSSVGMRWGNNPLLGAYQEFVANVTVTAANTTLDFTNSLVKNVTLQANTTFAFTSPAVSGQSLSVTLILRQDATGSRLVTWPTSVKWPAGTAPVLSTGASKVDVMAFQTIDAGVTWLGYIGGLDLR